MEWMLGAALFMFKDNSEILENAAKYLRESGFSK